MKLTNYFRILDRYIIKKYVFTFLFIMLLFSLVSVVFDLSEKIEKFLSKDLSAWYIIKNYYFNFIPWIHSLLFPLYGLITVTFFTSRMAGQTEIIPMLSAGISFNRLLWPFLFSGAIFTGLHLTSNHFVIPQSNKALRTFDNTYIKPGNIKNRDRNVHLFVAPDVTAFIRHYQNMDSSGLDFQMEKFNGEKIEMIFKAKSIKWKAEPNIWTLQDYEIRTIGDSSEILEIQMGQKMDSAIHLSPADFVFISNEKDMLTTPELMEFIERETKKGSGITKAYEIEFYRRTADPFTTLILSFIGVCIASRKVRGGLGLHLAAGIILGVVFIFLSKMSLTFASNEVLPTGLALWIPNLIFLTVGFMLLKRAQK
ncbi:MAG: LptF/LptG family permease [Saprospiraceae bacterium]|nr:LptF/LptG family permease [Saprospiraceae bacterium]